jgi:hypothetical protein
VLLEAVGRARLQAGVEQRLVDEAIAATSSAAVQ